MTFTDRRLQDCRQQHKLVPQLLKKWESSLETSLIFPTQNNISLTPKEAVGCSSCIERAEQCLRPPRWNNFIYVIQKCQISLIHPSCFRTYSHLKTFFTNVLSACLLVIIKQRRKRTQHCVPTTPNINIGCYMLRSFAHYVACCCMFLRVLAKSFKPVKILAKYKWTQHGNVESCWPTMLRSLGQ